LPLSLSALPIQNGTMVGTVTYPSGAATANAEVTIPEKSTVLVHSSNTNGSGNYALSDLPPGNYKVAVGSTGFKTATQAELLILEAI
jgi:Carboxypeptidase regulatory-like domain